MRGLSLLAALLLVATLAPLAQAQEKDWTILVYMDADNNLEPVGIVDFLELSSVGSNANVNVVVQIDRTPGFDTSHGDWTDARRFYVTPGLTPDPQNSLLNLGEVNMAAPATLSSFVTWGIANYPARYVFLVLWDHGDGWEGVVVDDDPVNGDRLTAVDLRIALDAIVASSGRRIDLLGNDACRMTVEIQYELAPYVDYFVGSEKDEPFDGWPYDRLLTALAADPAMTPDALASSLVDRYVESYEGVSAYSVALSAIRAAELRPLVNALDDFLGELAIEQPYFTGEVLAARTATEHYELAGLCCGDEYDLYHFIENVLARAPSRRLERVGTGLMRAIDAAVVHERHWDNPSPVNGVPAANAHGVSLWFPTIGGNPGYAALAFSADSAWDQFLLTYGIGVRPQVPANATAIARDSDADGRNDAVEISYRPAANGTMAVDLYRDGVYDSSRQFPAAANRWDNVTLPLPLGGTYELSLYLLASGDLVNLTVVPGLVAHELILFHGVVTGVDGRALDGASVTLRNPRTGGTLSTTTANGGLYEFRATYPSWFRDGDALQLEVQGGDIVARVTFNASMAEIGSDRSFMQNVYLSTAGMGGWIASLALLAIVAAVGFLLAFRYRQKYARFQRPP